MRPQGAERITMNTATLPETGYIRLNQLIGRKGERGFIPWSATTVWRKVAAGQFPKPVKLSPGVTAWWIPDVRAWMESKKSQDQAPE
jgi:prophage regulatory protein